MRCLLYSTLIAATLVPASGLSAASALFAASAQVPPKEPAVLVDHIKVFRERQRILVDGVVVANREQPIKGLRLRLEVLAPNEQLISWQDAQISKDQLEAGDDVAFYLQFPDQARAVSVRVGILDGNRVFLTVDEPGPYWIE